MLGPTELHLKDLIQDIDPSINERTKKVLRVIGSKERRTAPQRKAAEAVFLLLFLIYASLVSLHHTAGL